MISKSIQINFNFNSWTGIQTTCSIQDYRFFTP